MNIFVRIEIFKEGDVYVALAPELNVSSFGETIIELTHIRTNMTAAVSRVPSPGVIVVSS